MYRSIVSMSCLWRLFISACDPVPPDDHLVTHFAKRVKNRMQNETHIYRKTLQVSKNQEESVSRKQMARSITTRPSLTAG